MLYNYYFGSVLAICDVSPCKNGGVCNKNAALMCTCDSSHYGDYCQNGTFPIVQLILC